MTPEEEALSEQLLEETPELKRSYGMYKIVTAIRDNANILEHRLSHHPKAVAVRMPRQDFVSLITMLRRSAKTIMKLDEELRAAKEELARRKE